MPSTGKRRRNPGQKNELLFPEAAVFLPPSEQQAVLVAFERLETVELGEGFHEKYHQLAEELSGKEQTE